MGSILVKKPFEEGPISQKMQKTCKISHFCGSKTLEMGPDVQKFQKKKQKKQSNQLFLRGKNPQIWVGV